MSAQDLEQRARELLAAEYEAADESWAIWAILNPPPEKLTKSLQLSIRAIVAALRQQPGDLVDDARMARALEWVRALTKPCSAEEREMLANVEEAIAAYDPNCGARTVRVVDDAMRELIQMAREMVEAVRAIPESELMALDSDPHPPSSLSVAADDLEAALARAQGVQS